MLGAVVLRHGLGRLLGAGRSGDNPAYIESMYDFFRAAGDGLAHESYFNAGDSILYPSTRLSRTAQRYRDLF